MPPELQFQFCQFLFAETTGLRQQTFNFDTITGNLMVKGFRKGYYRHENYSYDNLDRLTEVSSVYREPASVSYSSNGNIQSRTGTGSYYYRDDKINAIDSITNSTTILPGPQNIEYTYFNKVSSITDSIDKYLYGLNIIYGTDQQRIKNAFTQNGETIKTKYYSPGFEKEVTTSITRDISYISCPYGLVAINIRQNSADSLYFVDTDHLGSILALIRNDGTEAAEYSYDEWGRRGRPSNWARYDTIPDIGFIDRGYTGHEHYDIFGLIDMNGRVYDPVIGRFLSPDLVIQFPDVTQSYNSYSYCVNNPLKWIDPKGFSAVKIAKENWGKFLAQVGILSLEFLCSEYKSNEKITEEDLINDFLTLIAAMGGSGFGGGSGSAGGGAHSACYGNGGLNQMLVKLFGEQFHDVYEKSQDPNLKPIEDKIILLANRLALHELGFNLKDVVRDTHSYGENSPLYSKLSKLDNYQYYTANWEPSRNSDSGHKDAKISPEIGLTGYALKYYSTKKGEVNAIGLVISRSLKNQF